jgi:hypothetical protein
MTLAFTGSRVKGFRRRKTSDVLHIELRRNTMKKCISVLVLSALVAGGAFAVDLAIGGGLLTDISGNNGIKGSDGGYDFYDGYRCTSFGVQGFFDITYVELGLYYAYGSMTRVVTVNGVKDPYGSRDAGSVGQFGFSLLGKYPIEVGSVLIFPMFGIDYNIVLSWKYLGEKVLGNESTSEWLSQFGLLAGLGVDFNLSEKLFLRTTGMFHIRLPAKWAKDSVDQYSNDAKATLGIGPRFTVALGYKL